MIDAGSSFSNNNGYGCGWGTGFGDGAGSNSDGDGVGYGYGCGWGTGFGDGNSCRGMKPTNAFSRVLVPDATEGQATTNLIAFFGGAA